jgi:hypothetical protein
VEEGGGHLIAVLTLRMSAHGYCTLLVVARPRGMRSLEWWSGRVSGLQGLGGGTGRVTAK